MAAHSATWAQERAKEIIARYADQPALLLPCLLALQAEFGWISDEAVAMAAAALNLSRAEAHGALTFYHDLRRAPPGRHVLKLCRAEACQARGGRAVEAEVQAALGVGFGETTPSGAVTLQATYCLGLCASGPAALLDDAPVARLSGARLARLLDEAQA